MLSDQPEPLISREELATTIFAIFGIADDVKAIRNLLEEDGDGEEEG